jgi:hypothetical protein
VRGAPRLEPSLQDVQAARRTELLEWKQQRRGDLEAMQLQAASEVVEQRQNVVVASSRTADEQAALERREAQRCQRIAAQVLIAAGRVAPAHTARCGWAP